MELKRKYKDSYNLLHREYKKLKEKIRSEYFSNNNNEQRRGDFEAALENIKEEHLRKLTLLYQDYQDTREAMSEQENVQNQMY